MMNSNPDDATIASSSSRTYGRLVSLQPDEVTALAAWCRARG